MLVKVDTQRADRPRQSGGRLGVLEEARELGTAAPAPGHLGDTREAVARDFVHVYEMTEPTQHLAVLVECAVADADRSGEVGERAPGRTFAVLWDDVERR